MTTTRKRSDTGRHLTVAQQQAAILVSPHVFPDPYRHGHGPLHWARGTFWPERLRTKADEWDGLAAAARTLADLMERTEP